MRVQPQQPHKPHKPHMRVQPHMQYLHPNSEMITMCVKMPVSTFAHIMSHQRI
jgi:hypothetical protein